jgi:uncharacterized protein
MRLLLAALFVFSVNAFAGEITVNGKCTRKVKPDRASLTFEINVQAPDAGNAQRRATAITSAVVKALKKLSFKDQELSTGNISLNEEFDYGPQGNQRKSRGFHANTSTTIATSEIDRAGEAIPAAMEAGAKSFGNLSVYLSDPLYDKSYQDCLGSALANAKAKAEKILGGENKLNLLELTEAGAGYNPRPIFSGRMEMAKASADAAPSIEVKESTVEASVTAKFKF